LTIDGGSDKHVANPYEPAPGHPVRNDLLVFSGRSHESLATSICAELGIALGRSNVVRFSNENLMVQIDENVREADVFLIETSAPPVNEYLVETLIYIDALKRASARRVTAVIPYFPYVRSDKKDKPRISITARLVADLLEAAGADRVLTMDLHSPQIQGFFKIPVDNLSSLPIMAGHIRDTYDTSNSVVVATDAGGAKAAGRFASRLGLDLAIVDKRRYADDERAKAEALIGDVEGRRAFLFDDEIASGGTIIEAADFLRRRGASSVVAGATHGVFTRDAVVKLNNSWLEEVVVTDTIPLPPQKRFDKLTVKTVAPLFAQAISAIHEGRSISALF
jgi:ribose-phosphate pyrophosphokinase